MHDSKPYLILHLEFNVMVLNPSLPTFKTFDCLCSFQLSLSSFLIFSCFSFLFLPFFLPFFHPSLLSCFLPSLSPFLPSFPLLSLFFFAISYNQCCGSVLVSVRIRIQIQLFMSMRIWNLGVESIRIRILVRL